MKKQKISDAVIHRLPRYYRYLDDLYNKGVVRISSSSLGDKMDITASQIRQDLSCFGEFGQQGYGYNVAELRAEIGHILGIDNGHRLIIIGVGHLGHALLQNFDFEKVGFQVDSAFDVSPALVDTQIRGVTIRPMDQLAEYVARYRPNVAVLTTRGVLDGGWIFQVSRDDDDGMWQFHTPGGELSEEDARIVSLHLIWKTDPSVAEVADLAPGWVAWREAVGKPWRRTVRDPE